MCRHRIYYHEKSANVDVFTFYQYCQEIFRQCKTSKSNVGGILSNHSKYFEYNSIISLQLEIFWMKCGLLYKYWLYWLYAGKTFLWILTSFRQNVNTQILGQYVMPIQPMISYCYYGNIYLKITKLNNFSKFSLMDYYES